jgi:hypothetical protein
MMNQKLPATHEFGLLVVAAFLEAEKVMTESADALDDQIFAHLPVVVSVCGAAVVERIEFPPHSRQMRQGWKSAGMVTTNHGANAWRGRAR